MPQVNRSQLIFIIIFLTLILPGPHDRSDGQSSPINRRRLESFKEEVQTSIKAVEDGKWESGYGNLTGFKLSYVDSINNGNITEWPLHHYTPENPWKEDEQNSILPNEISHRAKEIWNNEIESAAGLSTPHYLHNVTSTLRGSFNTANLTFTPIQMPVPEYLNPASSRPEYDMIQNGLKESSNDFGDLANTPIVDEATNEPKAGNVSEISQGILKLDIITAEKLESPYVEDVAGVTLKLSLKDFDEVHDNSLSLTGAYFQESGHLIAITRTAKFAGLYALPHLVLDEAFFNKTKSFTAERTKEINIDDLDLTSVDSLVEAADTKCEFIMYAQFKPSPLSEKELQDIDDELRNPLGRPIAKVPHVHIDKALIYSPDCGILVEASDLSGARREVQLKEIRHIVLLGIILLFCQIFLSINQMNSTNTPSTTSRISFWSIAMMNLADGSLSMLYLLCSAVIEELYLPLAVSSLLAFILASVFEMRYMILIYSSQINERTISARVGLQGTPIDDRVDTENGTILPTTQRPAQPEPQQQQQPQLPEDEQTISGQIYTRFFFVLVAFTFLILNSVMWPRKSRLVFEYIALFLLSSYWVPQIYRNVIRGSRKSYKWKFIFGTVTLRLLPVAYVCLYKENPFHHHYDPFLFFGLLAWSGLQILFLLLQEFLGPRFLLPDRYLPKSYDYHPILTEFDLENGFGINHDDPQQSLLNHQEDGKCKVDCAICMTEVDLPVQKSNAASANPAALLARRSYMVTPCRHIFHTACLEGWMKYKLQCPTCRNPLPPL